MASEDSGDNETRELKYYTNEERREPPETAINGPHAYRNEQFRNKEYIEWVRKEVKPLKYDIDERVIVTEGFNSLEQRSSAEDEEPEVVLMTQTSPDRLPFVRRMLELWNGPASAAVYIPYPKEHPEAAACVDRTLAYLNTSLPQSGSTSGHAMAASLMYANMESPNVHCTITEESTGLEEGWMNDHVWTQLFNHRPYLDIYDAEYPVGSLRQLALDLVPEDSFAFLVDADFVLVKDFAAKLKQGTSGSLLRYVANAWKERSERHAVIVPAFQREPEEDGDTHEEHACASSLAEITPDSDCWRYDRYEAPLTQTALHRMLEDGSITGFYEDKWSGSHGCYVPSEAIQKEEPFSIAYTHPCEPYVIAPKASLPQFDGRWRGRMLDKTSYITHMASWGFEFHVDPTSFIVHLPHSSGVALVERPEDKTDRVFADFWALPYGLTRVFLDDIRNQPQGQCEVIPLVKPLEEEDVLKIMQDDGAEKSWCKDANVADFDWARIAKEFSAPHACISGMECDADGSDVGKEEGAEGGATDSSAKEEAEAGATDTSAREETGSSQSEGASGVVERESEGESSTDDMRNNDSGAMHRKEGKGSENGNMPDTSGIAHSTNVFLRGALNPSQGKATMLWGAAGMGLLAWVLFIWFYHSTLMSKKRRYISLRPAGSNEVGRSSPQ